MLAMYWDVGRMIARRQKTEGWGAGVIPLLSRDIRNELPDVKGFSERNIGRMIAFYREYPQDEPILPRPVAKLDEGENGNRPLPNCRGGGQRATGRGPGHLRSRGSWLGCTHPR